MACLAPFKQDNSLVTEYYAREFAEQKNIKIQFNTEVSVKQVMAETPDAVIIATGGRPLMPEIPGMDSPNVVNYQDVLLDQNPVGDHVVIIGGGNIGCEVALELLINQGKKVTILEQLYRLADNVEIASRNCMLEELERAGAVMVTSARATNISENGVSYLCDGKAVTIQGDSIVLATGSKSESQLFEDLRYQMLPNLHIIGDAKQPRQIIDAISEGFYAAYYLV